jgi:DNA-binding MarR family transcriptional regulator
MSVASRDFVDALEGFMESFQKEQRGLLMDRNLTLVRLFALRWLSKAPDSNMSSFARLLGVRPQTVTPIVDSLEKDGLVRRVPSKEDRREARLELTAKGARVLESVRAAFREKLAQALDQTPPRSLRAATDALRIAVMALDRGAVSAVPDRHATQ